MLENYYAALESESCMDRSDDIGVTLSSVRLLILTTTIVPPSQVFCFVCKIAILRRDLHP